MSLNTPSDSLFGQATARDLANILHRQEAGLRRPYLNADRLAHALGEGVISIDRIEVSWRPYIDVQQLDRLLHDEKVRRIESQSHRVLKVHARLLAMAADYQAVLEPESSATLDRFPLRADLISWNVFGVSSTFECGTVDGRSVMAQLEAGHARVTVLPFSGLSKSGISGISFRRTENPPFPYIGVADAIDAWDSLRLSADSSAFAAAFM